MGIMNTGWTPTHAKCHPMPDCVPKYDQEGKLISNTPNIDDSPLICTTKEYVLFLYYDALSCFDCNSIVDPQHKFLPDLDCGNITDDDMDERIIFDCGSIN